MNRLGNSKITSKNQIYLSKEVLESLNAGPGDIIMFMKNTDEDVVLKKAKLSVEG